MATPRHKKDTKKYSDLSFDEQAKSINASIVNLQRAIRFHISASSNQNETRIKCIQQISRLLSRI